MLKILVPFLLLLVSAPISATTIAPGSVFSARSTILSDDGMMKLTLGENGLTVKKLGTFYVEIWMGERDIYNQELLLSNSGICTKGIRDGFYTYTCEYKTRNISMTAEAGIKSTVNGSSWKMQEDGNFVLYNSYGQAYLHTGTGGKYGSYIIFDNDGSLKLYSPSPTVSWQSKTVASSWYASSKPSAGTMTPGTILKSNQYLQSGNETFRLIMQSDGNFVLYEQATGKALWNSGTRGTGNWAVMQTDGNLVVYNASNTPLWSSGTAAKPSSYLLVQDDGNMVIYTPLRPTWATNTAVKTFATSSTGSGIIGSGRRLYAGDAVSSGNGTYSLIMQSDGNLVLYNVLKGSALWNTKTYGTGMSGVKAKLQTDGNFIVTDGADTKALFATWTQMYPSSFGAVQDDGNFVIYSPYMGVTWQTSSYTAGNTPTNVTTQMNYYDICSSGAVIKEGESCPIMVSVTPGSFECAVNYFGGVNNCVNSTVDWFSGLF